MIFDPFEEIKRLQERLNRLFEEFERFRFPERRIAEIPPIDVIDEGDKIKILADLPGFKKEDIEIYVEKGDLVIKAERREEEELKGKDFIKRERRYGRVFRRISLPSEVKEEGIKARYSNGVLEIEVPKIVGEKRVIPIE